MLQHKQKVSAIIRGRVIEDAIIYKDEFYKPNSFCKERYYICHNDEYNAGSESPDMFGYNYSYIFYLLTYNESLKNQRIFSDDVEIYEEGLLKKVSLDEKLPSFIETYDLSIFKLIYVKKGRFKDYDIININDKNLLVLESSSLNKKIEIKIGRFLNALATDNPELIGVKHSMFYNLQIDNNILEEITNDFLVFLNDKSITLNILKGKSILEGYNSENYLNNKGSLGESCMTNKFEFLELYTKNSNIELAILYFKDKIIARCLIWNTNEGKFYERIYCNFEWALNSMKNNMEKFNIPFIRDVNKLINVQLEYIPNYFPYVDTMRYLSTDNKILCNTNYINGVKDKSFNFLLNSQSGNHQILT